MLKSKIVLAGLVGLVVGFCLGSGFSYLWMKYEQEREIKSLRRLLVDYEMKDFEFVASEEEENGRQYFFSSPEVGIYALQRNISLLNHFKPRPLVIGPKPRAWDRTISYMRLGKLLRNTQDEIGAKEAFANALNASVGTGRRFKSVAELIEAVDKTDAVYLRSLTAKERSVGDKEQK